MSVHGDLREIDPEDTCQDEIDAIANVVDSIDDDLLDLISRSEDYSENLDEKTLLQIKEFIENLPEKLTKIKGRLY